MRISTLSIQPPLMPAISPIVPPMTMPDAMTRKAENQLVRIASSVRLKTSRLCSSMPNQCEPDMPVSERPTLSVSP